MSDEVLEKLVQKVCNMLSEIADVNLLIRQMTPTQETLNRINERVDAIFGALKQLENGVHLDEKKLVQLEGQTLTLQKELGSVNKMAEGLVDSFNQKSDGWTASVARCENKVEQLRVAVNDFGNKCNERLSLIRWVLIGTVILLLIVLIR